MGDRKLFFADEQVGQVLCRTKGYTPQANQLSNVLDQQMNR